MGTRTMMAKLITMVRGFKLLQNKEVIEMLFKTFFLAGVLYRAIFW